MAIDLSAIRNKLNQLNGQSSKRNIMWRPEEGEETTVRILAFPDNDGQPFIERYFYYNIGNNPGLLTPNQFGKPDPIQELINKLRDEGTKESYEMAKKLYPKMRAYAPVIVRGEEDKGVRIWAFGKTIYQNLLNFMLDEDYGDITDPIDGRDIRVLCTKTPGRMWATTEVRPRGKSSPLHEDQTKAKKMIDSIPDIDNMFSLKSYEELEGIINNWLNDDEDNPSNSGQKESYRGGSSNSGKDEFSPDNASNKYKSLDDAFADLTS